MAKIQFDYESVYDRLKTRTIEKLKALGKNDQNTESLLLFSTNAAILDACAEEIADAALYDEYLTREAVWETALGRNSIVQQVGFYNYKPHRKIGAKGTIKVSTSKTFDAPWIRNIFIPKFTQFSGGGSTFLSSADSFLSASKNYSDVHVTQGAVIQKEITVTEAAFPELKYLLVTVKDPDIEDTLYEVKVNGEVWKEVFSLRLCKKDTKGYTLKTLPDMGGVEIEFGNGQFGRKLEYGDVITFTYLQTSGVNSNVLSANVVTTLDSVLFDEQGEQVEIFCTNTNPLVGGADYEPLSEIRAQAPLSFQTGNRAISSIDYRTIIDQINIADKIQVWGEKEINEDRGNKPGTYIAASENLIYITGITVDRKTQTGVPLQESAKALIRRELNDKKGTTDILQFVDSHIIYVTFVTDAYVADTRYSGDQIIRNIHTALVGEYGIEKGEYKKSLYFSDYYRLIDSAEGVDHHRTNMVFSQFFTFQSAYLFKTNINLDNILPKSVKLYIRDVTKTQNWTLMAKDDGDGAFLGEYIDPTDHSKGKYQLPGAVIKYADGSIGEALVTFGLDGLYGNYELKLEFELSPSEQGDLKIKYRHQIFAFLADKTTVHYMGVN